MAEQQNTLLGFLQQSGSTEIAGVLAIVGILVLWLIIRILKRAPGDNAPNEAALKTKRDYPASEPTPTKALSPDAALSNQAGFVQRATSTESKVTAVAEAKAVSQSRREIETISQTPEDSILRRHFLANQLAQQQAITDPYPTDSVLRRHYEGLHKLAANVAAPITSRAVEPVVAAEIRSTRGSIIENAINKDSQAVVTPTPIAVKSAINVVIPQDSILKRHFMSQLQAEVEAKFAPAPSDSVLLRHYQSLVRAELNSLLAKLNG